MQMLPTQLALEALQDVPGRTPPAGHETAVGMDLSPYGTFRKLAGKLKRPQRRDTQETF